jgi:hypothetical protein
MRERTAPTEQNGNQVKIDAARSVRRWPTEIKSGRCKPRLPRIELSLPQTASDVRRSTHPTPIDKKVEGHVGVRVATTEERSRVPG